MGSAPASDYLFKAVERKTDSKDYDISLLELRYRVGFGRAVKRQVRFLGLRKRPRGDACMNMKIRRKDK